MLFVPREANGRCNKDEIMNDIKRLVDPKRALFLLNRRFIGSAIVSLWRRLHLSRKEKSRSRPESSGDDNLLKIKC